MAMGMSYEQFWDGDPIIAKYYREAEDVKTNKANEMAWLSGFYIYDALMAVQPSFNSIKPRKPFPYRDKPIPLTRMAQEAEERRKFEELKRRMFRQAERANQAFFKKQKEKGGENNG